MQLTHLTRSSIQTYMFLSVFILTSTFTGVITATIGARQLNATDVPAGGKVVVASPIQQTLSEVLVDSLIIEELRPFLQDNKDIAAGGGWSPINLEWEGSGDESPADATEPTTEVATSERVNEPDSGTVDGVESRMDADQVTSAEVRSAEEDAAESRMDADDVADEPVPVTTAVPPVRVPQKPVRPMATNSLVPPPPPPPPSSPPLLMLTELRPFNPVVPVKNNVWDVRVSTHTLTKPAAATAAPHSVVLNVAQEADERLDYDYSGEELPPSLPNLDIIPFVAADAVVGVPSSLDEEDERLTHKTMRHDLAGGSAVKRPAVVIADDEHLNEKGAPARSSSGGSEEAPSENKRNLWLINGTNRAPASAPSRFDQSNEPAGSEALSAGNNAEHQRQQQQQQPKKPAKPSAVSKFPMLVPRPSIPPRKTIHGSTTIQGFGSLRVESCNIYGQMYYVGNIVPELSGPCSECKCTEIGVSCFDLKCN